MGRNGDAGLELYAISEPLNVAGDRARLLAETPLAKPKPHVAAENGED